MSSLLLTRVFNSLAFAIANSFPYGTAFAANTVSPDGVLPEQTMDVFFDRLMGRLVQEFSGSSTPASKADLFKATRCSTSIGMFYQLRITKFLSVTE
jgi:hypothetical protein